MGDVLTVQVVSYLFSLSLHFPQRQSEKWKLLKQKKKFCPENFVKMKCQTTTFMWEEKMHSEFQLGMAVTCSH